ncbi:hypothetical protein BCR44DRAFT_60873 [Catenaria anguillulae PL171]|uniref:Uncharacterized protein n=1 Tax=Catenaria anguillulae PL171 TaxID=765915 RepID=A0A1Y2HCC0_9FUNG|nr:hypothetical protein BCR44DRAFT_60873 [Catenaria anguillulae PL171]
MNDAKSTPAAAETLWNLRHVTKTLQGDSSQDLVELIGTLAACAFANRHAVVLTPAAAVQPTISAIRDIASQVFQASSVCIHLPLHLSNAQAASSSSPSASASASASAAADPIPSPNHLTASSSSFPVVNNHNQIQNDNHRDHTPLLSGRSFEPFPSLAAVSQPHEPADLNRLFQSQLILPAANHASDPIIHTSRTTRHATMDSISAASVSASNNNNTIGNNTLLRRRLISLPGGGAGARSTSNTQSHRRSLVDPLANPSTTSAPPPSHGVANVGVLVLNENSTKLDVQVQEAMLEVMHSGHVNDGRHLVPLPSNHKQGLFMWVVVVPYRDGIGAGDQQVGFPKVGMCAQLMTHFLFSTILTSAPAASPMFPNPLPANLHLTPARLSQLLALHPPAPIHMDIRRYLHDLLVSLRTCFPTIPIAANLVNEWILALNVVCHPSMYGVSSSVVTPDVVQWVVTRVVVHRILIGTACIGGGSRSGRKRAKGKVASVKEVVQRVAWAVERVEIPV